ncbi:MAG: hypothetical protein LUI05_09855 [Oscillospiraceae bacterium]|nr:hypothetical protein [Oscillospiraceae bacterium]
MTMKKIAASIMAVACMAACATSISADTLDNTTMEADVTVDVTTNVPTLSVTVPTTAEIVINPYKLTVTTDAGDSTDTVISAEQEISNASDCAVSITVTGAVTVPETSSAVVATAALKGTETTKSVFLYVEGVAGDTAFADAYAKADNQLALSTKSASKTLMTLDATSGTGKVKIDGEAATAPTEAWTTADTVTVALAYKIAPVAAE